VNATPHHHMIPGNCAYAETMGHDPLDGEYRRRSRRQDTRPHTTERTRAAAPPRDNRISFAQQEHCRILAPGAKKCFMGPVSGLASHSIYDPESRLITATYIEPKHSPPQRANQHLVQSGKPSEPFRPGLRHGMIPAPRRCSKRPLGPCQHPEAPLHDSPAPLWT